MSLSERIRYEWVSLVRGTPFLRQVKQEAIRQFMGHTKVIGWENGLPVRSLTVPAEFSPAFVQSTARLYNSFRSKIDYPGVASLSITHRCDCSCPHCFAFGQEGEDLGTAAWIDVVRQALDLGVFSFVINGGEPLLRADLPDILSAIDPARATCLLYTNGSHLAEQALELRRAGLRRVALALDSDRPDEHDRHRGQPGLFSRLLAGFEAARHHGMLVGFSTFSTPERVADGTLERIFRFARQNDACEVIVYDALPAGRLSACSELKQPMPEYTARLRTLIEPWWAGPERPGIWWYGHISSPQNLGCSGGIAMFSVAHDGHVRPCDFCRQNVGRVQDHRLADLWDRLNRAARHRRTTQGNTCLLRQDG
jgi:MoaA/NifB/PqqE/SkfB family radical SAM enzyme